MAEEEKIRGHAKHALQNLVNKKKGWKERLSSFLWEIFIIIVAVNITLWFHSWSEKRHDRKLEKNFLIGTRNDLNIVEGNLKNFEAFFQPVLDYYDSVWIQMNEHRINKKFIDANSSYLFRTAYFFYDNSRYESYKSSGSLRLIENDSLSMKIAFIYTVLFPKREYADQTIFNTRRQFIDTYIGSKARIDSSGIMYVSELLDNPEVRYQMYNQKFILQEMMNQKKEMVQEIDDLIAQIDNELKKRFNY